MAKNNVGKKPISQEEYTTNKVLAVFSVCLLGVLVLMILERLHWGVAGVAWAPAR